MMPAKPVDKEQIFNRAAELSGPAERAAFLDDACGDDTRLRGEIEQLLRHDNDAGSFLEQPLAAFVATIAGSPFDTVDEAAGGISLGFLQPSDKPGCLGTLDQYGVVEVVGRGGMGIVLRAHDPKLNRVVAIKVMAPELAANAMAVKRFLREAQAAAAVSHDHVVTIHAIHDVHRPPFIVMEFVNGQSLQEKIDRRGALELVEILRIGMQTAAGLAAAHQQGLVHRDIKPANILLENGVERVKLTDFGLARAVDDVSVTQTGQIAGTPQYMSPEQALGHAVDARSDLFSLGSVLYTMCAGRPPFRAETAIAMLRRVCDDEPRPIREVNSEIPDWLETIVFGLLAKEPADRIQSAAEVGDLLAQHLAHVQHPTTASSPQPIAPPIRRADSQTDPSAIERQFEKPIYAQPAGDKLAPRRSVVRPVLAAIAGAAAFLFLAAFAAVIIYVRTNHGTVRIEVNDPNTTVTIDGGMGVNMQNAENARFLKVRVGEHTLHVQQGDLEFDTESFRVRRGEEVLVKIDRVDGSLTAHLLQPEHHVRDGSTITIASQRLLARAAVKSTVVDASTQDQPITQGQEPREAVGSTAIDNSPAAEFTEVGRLEGHQERVYFVGHSADGRYVYSGGRDQSVRLWDVSTGTQIKQFNAKAPLRSADMSRDGRILVAAGYNQTVTVWDVETGDVIRELHDHNGPVSAVAVALSDDATQLAAATQSKLATDSGRKVEYLKSVKLWNLASGQAVWEQTDIEPGIGAVSFSPDGARVMVCARHAIAILDRGSGEVISRLPSGSEGNRLGFRTAAYSPNGQWVALGCFGDGTGAGPSKVGLWDGKAEQPVRWLGQHGDDAVTGLSFSPDGRYLLTGGLDRTLRLWEIESGRQLAFAGVGTQYTQFVSLLSGGQYAVTGGGERWNLEGQSWVGDGDFALRLWRLPESLWPQPSSAPLFTTNDTEKLLLRGHRALALCAVYSPDGRSILSSGGDDPLEPEMILWNANTGEQVRRFVGHKQTVRRVAISPDGRFALSGSDDKTMRLWNIETGEQVRSFGGHDETVYCVAFSSDGKRAAYGSGYHAGVSGGEVIRLWNVETGEELGSLGGHQFAVLSVQFSADGRRILSGSADRTVRLWDVDTSEEIRRFDGPVTDIHDAVFSPDERFVFASALASIDAVKQGTIDDPDNGQIWMWETKTGQVVRTFRGHRGCVNGVAVSPDGRFLASASGGLHPGDGRALIPSRDNTVRLWDIESGRELVRFAGHAAHIESVAFSPDSRSIASCGYDRTVRVWEVPESIWQEDGKQTNEITEVNRYEGHADHVSALAVSSDGTLLVSASADGTARVWDVRTRRVLQTFKGHRKERQVCVAISPDGGRVVTGDWDGLLRIWNRSADRLLVEADAHAGGICEVAFSPDGSKILSTGCDNTAKLWDPQSGKQLVTLTGHTSWVNDVDFFPDGRQVVTTSSDTTVRVWDVDKGTETLRFPTQQTISQCVCVSPDGNTVAAGFGDGSVRLFDAVKGDEVHRLTGHTDCVLDVVFTPDGRHLLSGSFDRTLRVWDLKRGTEVARISHEKHVFNTLAVTFDGLQVFSAGGIWKPDNESNEWVVEFDYAIHVWRLPESLRPNLKPSADSSQESSLAEIGLLDASLPIVQLPIARLLGKPVFRHDCLSHSDGIGSAEVGLQRLVLEVLSAEFCKDKELELSQAEVDAFVARCQTAARQAVQAERRRIEEDLTAADLTEEKKQDLLRHRDQLPADDVPRPPPFDADKEQQTLDAIRLQLADDHVPWLERLALQRKEREQALLVEHQSRLVAQAHAQLLPLRRARALYQRYGGKVVATQLGFILIGADFKLLEQAEQSGQLEFLDDDLKQAFWRRMDNDFKRPELSPEQFDFQWPFWLSDQALDNLK